MYDDLGDRMKRYETTPKHFLMRRTPVIIRLDGKAFHSWTRWCERPFDDVLSTMMADTLVYLIKNIQGAVFGFTQSDEISILVRDYDTLTTDMWFDGNIQKITSVSASLATGYFNDIRPKDTKLAFFDSRAFNIPREEVCNMFIWRQNDCMRNSIQAFGQYHLGHSAIQGLNNGTVLKRLEEKNIHWSDIKPQFRYGVTGTKQRLDFDVPIFTTDREYIEQHVYLNEQNN